MEIDKDFITIHIIGMTHGISLNDAYILIGKNPAENRIFPILISKSDCEIIFRAMQTKEYPTVDLASRIAYAFDLQIKAVIIRFPHRGNACACILMQDRNGEEQKLTTSTGNGVAMAFLNHTPLCLSEKDYQDLAKRSMEDGRVAIPISRMSDELLEEAMQSAVKEENFELASQLRDELKQRALTQEDDPF